MAGLAVPGLRLIRKPGYVYLAAAIGYLAVVYIAPILRLFTLSFAGGDAYGRTLTEVNLSILLDTFVFAALITVLTLFLSYPIAYVAATSGPRIRNTLIVAVTIPLFTSLLVRTIAWLALLGRLGVVNTVLSTLGLVSQPLDLVHNTFGFCVGSLYILVPLMVLALFAPMRDIDLSLIRSARTLGARPAQAFVQVYLPLSVPGIMSAALLVFIVATGFFVTPALLGGFGDSQFSSVIQQTVSLVADVPGAAALGVILLGCSVVLLAAFGSLAGFDQFVGGQLRHSDRRRTTITLFSVLGRLIGRLGAILTPLEAPPLRFGFVTLMLAFLFSPLAVILPMSISSSQYIQFPPPSLSLQWYEYIFSAQTWRDAGENSLVVGLGATVIAVAIAILAGLGLREVPKTLGRAIVPVLIAPMMIPAMIYSIAAYTAANRLGISDTILGLVLSHSALAIPYAVIVIATALSRLNPLMEAAARTLGAGRWATLTRVVLPLVMPSIAIGGLLAFITSFDEIVVTLLMSGPTVLTVPRRMWDGAVLELNPAIFAVAVVVLSLVAILALGVWILVRTLRIRDHTSEIKVTHKEVAHSA